MNTKRVSTGRVWRIGAGSLVAALCWVTLASAGDINWNNTAGGSFETGGNWVGGTAPGSGDTALFGVNSTFAAASQPIGITFGGSPTNTVLSVQDAAWNFALGGHTYTLSTSVAVGALRQADSVAGTAILNLSNGTLSTVSSVLGNATGTSGTVNVTGPGATWNNSSFVGVGATGTGALNILNGGVATGTALDLGVFASSASGAVTVSGTGSKWTGSDFLRVGNTGSGSLLISNGGSVSDTSWSAGGPQPGTITVTGAGSTWTNSSSGGVQSSSGQSSLQILSGGVASGTAVDVAVNAGNSGSMTVDGTGSKWTGSDFLRVGFAGNGTLTISNGGAASGTQLAVGGNGGGTGTALITDAGSSWTGTAQAQVGNAGTGTLTVTNGATMTSAKGASPRTSGVIGVGTGTGTATVSGGATWNQNATLQVGFTGAGTLNVTGGGTVNSASGVIGSMPGGVGTVLVTGAGSKWDNTATAAAGCTPCAAGNLDVGLAGGGTGTLTVDSGGVVKANTITIGSNGLLNGDGGTVQGAVVVDGVVKPGHSPGVLNINGNFTLNADGTLTLVVAGPSSAQYSHLNITGTGTFNGLIDLDFVNGFAPTTGQTFAFISMGGLTTPTNVTYQVEGLNPGFQFDPMFTSEGFSIEATNDASPVPEPATLALVSAGLAALAWRRRGRSSRIAASATG